MILRPLFVSLLVVSSIGAADNCYAQDADLFVSINHPNSRSGPGAVYFYTPAGVQGTALASVPQPRGVAFDCAGNLFVASWDFDENGNFTDTKILEVTPDGAVSTFTSAFPNNFPLEDIKFDSYGNLFVMGSDFNNPSHPGIILKIAPGGGVSTFGSVGAFPFGLAFDSTGNLFSASLGDQTIYKFTPSATRSIFVGPSAFSPGRGPAGLAFDASGNLFVSTEDSDGSAAPADILEFAPNGTETTFATGLTGNPRGLAFDSVGDLFVAETGVPLPGSQGDVLKFTPAGAETVFAVVGFPRPQGNAGPQFLTFPPSPCQFPSAVAANFNGTQINSGSTIWFSSVLSRSGIGSAPVTFRFTNQTISSTSFSIPVPDAQVTFDPAATTATTTFTGGKWVTRVPASGVAGNTFFSGASYQVPANIPGGLKSVAWSGTISSDRPTASLQWKWSAAVYSSFGSDYNSDGIKPVDDNKTSMYQNSDHAGTPENFKSNVIGGATGGGGSNYTGSLSGTVKVGPCCSQ